MASLIAHDQAKVVITEKTSAIMDVLKMKLNAITSPFVNFTVFINCFFNWLTYHSRTGNDVRSLTRRC